MIFIKKAARHSLKLPAFHARTTTGDALFISLMTKRLQFKVS